MRRCVATLFLMTSILFVLNSCQVENAYHEPEEQAMSDLYQKIRCFEDNNDFICPTRGILNNLYRTAAWDAPPLLLNIPLPGMGYFISGIVSMFAAVFIFNEEPELAINSANTELLASEAPSLDSIGIEHNECLSTILQEPALINAGNPQKMINVAISIIKEDNPDCPFSCYADLESVFPLIEDIISCTSEQELFNLCRQNVSTQSYRYHFLYV